MKKIKYLLILLLIIVSNFSNAQVWEKFNDSLFSYSYSDPVVLSFYELNDTLFVGGIFDKIGNTIINKIVFWDGYKWNSMNYIVPGGQVNDIIKFQNNIYICGTMSDYNLNISGITYWNGIAWNSLDTIFPSAATSVNSLEVFGNKLFFGGQFSRIGNFNNEGEEYRRIAAYDGSNWLHVGDFDYGPTSVYSLVTYNNELYAGGNFNYSFGPDTLQTLLVAKYQGGQQWTNVGTGLWNGEVVSLVVDTINNFLYAGGGFYIPNDSQNGCCIARWDGFEWKGLGGGLNMDLGGRSKMGFYHGDLYMSGWFTQAGNITVNHIARWNGVQWDSVPGVDGSHVTTFIEYNDWLVVGGNFTSIGGIQTNAIAKLYLPIDSTCPSFTPLVQTYTDTAFLNLQGEAQVQFYNNNAYSPYWNWDFGDSGTDTIRNPLHTFTDTGTFHVCVTTSNNMCEKTGCRDIVVLLQTSITNNLTAGTNADLRIYPNPASGIVTIEVTSAQVSPSGVRGSEGKNNEPFDKLRVQQTINELRITDQHGKTVKNIAIKENHSKTEINTKGWAKGAYLCCLVSEGKTVKVEKLVIE